jgi:hypothetical protein
MLMQRFDTIGDVRYIVNEAFESDGLETFGGNFYPNIQAITFGLLDESGNRRGDAHCLLPEDGWLADNYWPGYIGEPTNRNDRLRLSVVKGSGRLILPTIATLKIVEGIEMEIEIGRDGIPYHLVSGNGDLLVVHAESTQFPSNPTHTTPTETAEIDDNLSLASNKFFSYSEIIKPRTIR